MVTQKRTASWAGRLPVSPAVLWTGIALGVFLAVEAMVHGTVLPLALGAVADAALTFLLIVAVAVILAELTRRHHLTVLRHGGRLSAAGARRVRRRGSGVVAWLAARAGSWWASRERRRLMFRRAGGRPEDPPAEPAPATERPAGGPAYSWGLAGSQNRHRTDDLDEAIGRARYYAESQDRPFNIMEHPADGGPGRVIATYEHGKPSQPEEGNTPMPSKISTGHRAQRAARTGAPGVPSEWAAVVAGTADFEPENDGELLDWMGRQVTGLSAWAEALVDTYEHCTSVIGIDPQASTMLHDVADAAAQAAETMGAAKAKFMEHYELPREFAANGGLMTHDGRWITGDGA